MQTYDLLNHVDNTNVAGVVCSRCLCQPLTEKQFKRERNGCAYCEECFTWLDLQHHTDEKGNKYTLRSERVITSWPQ
jgi:hypothetical protein